MIGSVREQDRVAPGSLERSAEVLDDALDPIGGLVCRRELSEIVVVRQELTGDHLAPRRTPPEQQVDIAETAREEERREAEAGEQLRELRRVTEAVGRVAGPGRLPAEAAADAPPEQKVANEALATNEQLVGKHIPGPDLEPARSEQRAQPCLVVGSHVDVVLEHDRLPVEREREERRIPFEHVEHLVERLAES